MFGMKTFCLLAVIGTAISGVVSGNEGLTISHSVHAEGGLNINVIAECFDDQPPLQGVPLSLKLNSRGSYSSVLPNGWSIPMIDSHIVQERVNKVFFVTPVGERFFCNLQENSISGSGWSGEVDSDRIVLIRNGRMERVEFRGGKILRYTKKGNSFQWKYDQKNTLKEVQKNGDSFFRVNRSVSGVDDFLEIRGEKNLLVHSLRSNGAIGVPADYVTKISLGEEVIDLQMGTEADSGDRELVFSENGTTTKFGWNDKGIVNFAEGIKYDVVFPHPLAHSPHIFATDLNGVKTLVSAAMGAKESSTLKFREDGSFEETFYISIANIAQVRKIVVNEVDGTSREIYRAHFHKEGYLLKDWTPKSERKREGNLFRVYENGKFSYSYPADY